MVPPEGSSDPEAMDGADAKQAVQANPQPVPELAAEAMAVIDG